jgi:hypothetical protein
VRALAWIAALAPLLATAQMTEPEQYAQDRAFLCGSDRLASSSKIFAERRDVDGTRGVLVVKSQRLWEGVVSPRFYVQFEAGCSFGLRPVQVTTPEGTVLASWDREARYVAVKPKDVFSEIPSVAELAVSELLRMEAPERDARIASAVQEMIGLLARRRRGRGDAGAARAAAAPRHLPGGGVRTRPAAGWRAQGRPPAGAQVRAARSAEPHLALEPARARDAGARRADPGGPPRLRAALNGARAQRAGCGAAPGRTSANSCISS